MYTVFSDKIRHSITEANINFYATPFVHPKRTMKEHDFIYMLQGEWKFGQNSEVYNLTKDHILILSADNTHYGIEPCTPDTKTMYFHVTSEGDSSYAKPHQGECIESLIDVSFNPDIKKIFSEIVNCKLHGKDKKANMYFELLLLELYDNDNTLPKVNTALHIKDIIHNNPEKFFSNKELAKLSRVSVKTAETQFKSMFNMTIHQYMLDFKIDEAITYFKNFPDITVKETAYNLGFYDEYHFSKQFKKITGTSPVEYKKNLSKSDNGSTASIPSYLL